MSSRSVPVLIAVESSLQAVNLCGKTEGKPLSAADSSEVGGTIDSSAAIPLENSVWHQHFTFEPDFVEEMSLEEFMGQKKQQKQQQLKQGTRQERKPQLSFEKPSSAAGFHHQSQLLCDASNLAVPKSSTAQPAACQHVTNQQHSRTTHQNPVSNIKSGQQIESNSDAMSLVLCTAVNKGGVPEHITNASLASYCALPGNKDLKMLLENHPCQAQGCLGRDGSGIRRCASSGTTATAKKVGSIVDTRQRLFTL